MISTYLKSIVVAWLAATALMQNAAAQNYSANVPPVYEEPGGSSKRGADASFGVESIDPFTGALKIVTTDLTIPSNGGLDLQIVRNYHSFQTAQDSGPRTDYLVGRTATGIGWDLHFGRLWKAGADGVAPQLSATDTNNQCRLNVLTNKNNPVLELPDGSRRLFSASNSTETGFAYITADRWILKCLPTAQDTYGNGGAIVISPEGIKYTFNFFQHVSNSNVSVFVQDANSGAAFHATKIEHPNGTVITINYVPKASSYFATLSTVTHSEGQSVSFSYTGTNVPNDPNSTAHLQSFTQVGTSRTWTFTYVTAVVAGDFLVSPGPYEYLDSVLRPDGRTTSYRYVGMLSKVATVPGQFSLRQVITPLGAAQGTNPLGGAVTYTYGQQIFATRDTWEQPLHDSPKSVVTRKDVMRGAPGTNGTISNGLTDTWTYNYRPSTSSAVKSDFTDISGPTNCTTYEHYVEQIANTGWKVGSLLSHTIAAPNTSSLTCSSTVLRTETNTWTSDLVADQQSYRYPAALVDSSTFAPRPIQQVIIQDGTAHTTAFNNPDAFGNPQQILETGLTTLSNGSSAPVSRTTNATYFTDTSAWILHRLKNETVPGAGPTYLTPTSAPLATDYTVVRAFFTSGAKLGLLQTETRAGIATSFDYFTGAAAGGALNTVTDANGFATTYSNYKRGIAQLTVRPIDSTNSVSINRTVNDSGTLASQQDGELKQTGYAYNGINQLTGVTTARTDDVNLSITRTATGSTSDVVSRGPYQETRQYDGFGTLVRTDWVDNGGSGTPSVFQKTDVDAEDRVIRRYLPNSLTSFVKTDYDALNRPTLVTQPDNSTVKYEYLPNEITRVTDERSFQTINSYRSFGDPAKRELMQVRADRGDTPGALYQTTYMDRNLIGDVNSITQEGVTRTYKYNSHFMVFEEDHPEVGAVVYARDNVGNVISRKVAASGTTIYTPDRLYRTTNVAYPDGTSVVLGYYKNDRLKNVTKGATRWDYIYDGNNNLTSELLTVNARPYSLVNSYDAIDTLSGITYPSGLAVSYAPNAFGQPTQVGSGLGNFASSISYYPNGQLKGFTAGNGFRTDLGQNARLFPTTLVSSKAAVIATNVTYGYDAAGNTQDIADNFDGSQSRHMSYDGLNRVRIANGGWGTGQFTYDGNNNISTKQLGSESLTYHYNSTTARLDSITGTYPRTFQYDVYGNVKSNGTPARYGVFTYDDASNMTLVGSPGTITYNYDGNSRMTLETLADGTSTRYTAYNRAGKLMYDDDVVSRQTVDYIYLGSQLLASRTRVPTAITPTKSTVVATGTGGVTLTVSIGGTSPSGTVTFTEGGSVIGVATVTGGQASINVQGLAVGSHTITATYSGDNSNAGNAVVFQVRVVNMGWLPAVLELLLN